MRHQLTPITHLLASVCKWGGDLGGGSRCASAWKSSETEQEGMTWSEGEKRGLRRGGGGGMDEAVILLCEILGTRDERMMSHISRRIAYTNTFPRPGLQKRKGRKVQTSHTDTKGSMSTNTFCKQATMDTHAYCNLSIDTRCVLSIFHSQMSFLPLFLLTVLLFSSQSITKTNSLVIRQ